MIKSLTWRAPAAPWQHDRRPRLVAAMLLRTASAILARLARQLAAQPIRSDPLAVALEFYAEAGAPEGALYADGQLVGYVSGITRL